MRRDRIFVPEPEAEREEELIDTKHTRRFFFGILAGATAALVSPPGLITDSISLTIHQTGNRLLTVEEITRETLRILERNTVFARTVSASFDGRFYDPIPANKFGETLSVRKPLAFRGRHGNTYPA